VIGPEEQSPGTPPIRRAPEKLDRYLGPGVWMDTDGGLHFSAPEIMTHFGLPDTEESRTQCMEMIRELLQEQLPEGAIIITRK
jgi:hypothetical protein